MSSLAELPELHTEDFWPDPNDLKAIEEQFAHIQRRAHETLMAGDIGLSLSYGGVLAVLGNMLPRDDERNPAHVIYHVGRQQG